MNIHHNDCHEKDIVIIPHSVGNTLHLNNINTNVIEEVKNSELIEIITIQSKIMQNICDLQKLVNNTNPESISLMIKEKTRIAQELINNRKLLLIYLNKLITDLSYTTISKENIKSIIPKEIREKSVENLRKNIFRENNNNSESVKGFKVVPT